MRLDPRQLRVLRAIVTQGSFSAAARSLNMTQPAVSMLISQLERTLGVKVVKRGPLGAVPTATGEVLSRRATMLENVLNLAAEEVATMAAGVQGPLVVGGTPGALMSVLPAALRELHTRGAAVSLRIVEAPDADLTGMLRDYAIDVAIGTVAMVEPPADIAERRLFLDDFVLVTRPDHDVGGATATLLDLAGLAWVLPDVGGAFKRQIEAIFLIEGLPLPTNAVRCDSLASTKEIVRVTDRVTILPQRVVLPELVSGSLRGVALRPTPPPREVGIRTLRDRPHPPLLALLVDAMRAVCTS